MTHKDLRSSTTQNNGHYAAWKKIGSGCNVELYKEHKHNAKGF